jgi:hypothetical protein
MVLTELPRTSSGKADKQSLAELLAARPDSRPPGTPDVARALRAAVAEITGTDGAPLDRSFAELGLTSVEVIRVYHRLGETLGEDLDIMRMFEPVRLIELAGLIERDRAGAPATRSRDHNA